MGPGAMGQPGQPGPVHPGPGQPGQSGPGPRVNVNVPGRAPGPAPQ